MNIYVGNLPHEVSEEDLRTAFEAFGAVDKVAIIKDRYTGAPRGFGFVEMATKAEAEAAIEALNGKDMQGRTLTVHVARERPRREGGGGGGRRGPGGGRGPGGNRRGSQGRGPRF